MLGCKKLVLGIPFMQVPPLLEVNVTVGKDSMPMKKHSAPTTFWQGVMTVIAINAIWWILYGAFLVGQSR